ncbi:hypothetical protein KKA47_02970 [bacterium]|nr:hypothetical protein [bacterium]
MNGLLQIKYSESGTGSEYIPSLETKKEAFESQIQKHQELLESSEYLTVEKEKELQAQIDNMQAVVTDLTKLIEALKAAEASDVPIEEVLEDYDFLPDLPIHIGGYAQYKDKPNEASFVPSNSEYLGSIYVDTGKESTVSFYADINSTEVKVNTHIDAVSGKIYQIVTFDYLDENNERVLGSYVFHDNPNAGFIIDASLSQNNVNIDCSQAIRLGMGNFAQTQATNGFIIYCSDIESGSNKVIGSMGKDLIFGGKAVDEIYGMGGNDGIYGAGGNDILVGGGGVDAIEGGAGIDIGDKYEFESYPDQVDVENTANLSGATASSALMNQIVSAGDDWNVSVDSANNEIVVGLKEDIDDIDGNDIFSSIQLNMPAGFEMVSGHMENQNDMVVTFMSTQGGNPVMVNVRIKDRFNPKIADCFDPSSIKIIGNSSNNIMDFSSIQNAVVWLEGKEGNDILLASSDEMGKTHSTMVGGSGNDLMIGNDKGNEVFIDSDTETDIIIGGSNPSGKDVDIVISDTVGNDYLEGIEEVLLPDAIEDPKTSSVALSVLYESINDQGICLMVSGNSWSAEVNDSNKEIVLSANSNEVDSIGLIMPGDYNVAMKKHDGNDLLVTFVKQNENGVVATITLRIVDYNNSDIDLSIVNQFGQLIQPVQL